MTRTTPAAMAAATETRDRLPFGAAERFHGHGVLGLTFDSGDILAFRRFPGSSVGPPYSSVWHRDPAGSWALFTDVPVEWTCARYFGAALSRVAEDEIDFGWTGDRALAIAVPGHGLDWAIRIESGLSLRLATLLLRLAPPRLPVPPVSEAPPEGGDTPPEDGTPPGGNARSALHSLAVPLLGSGPLRLRGRTPNGQAFAFRPRRAWHVTASAATVAGRDLGPLASHRRPVSLGDLVLPTRGLFTIGDWHFGPYDPTRHHLSREGTAPAPPGP